MTHRTSSGRETAATPSWLRNNPRRVGLVGATAAGLVLAGATTVMAANPPAGPGNIEIFPNRDMVAIEGYVAQAGQQVTIDVTRNGQPVGTASGTVDATGFYEINHPGGSCWKVVTPNIQSGDVVTATFADGTSDSATVGSAAVTDIAKVDLGATDTVGDAEHQVVITGEYGDDVDTSRFAVEIVNPEMREAGSTIGERAIGWPEDDVPTTYTVDGVAENGTFTVTYGFYNAADRDLAFTGDPVALSWLAEPVGVEQQLGLTLAEYRELDGPGFGGCPTGPVTQAPNAPSDVFAVASGSGSITATWSPATVPADAAGITGYQVVAVDGERGQEISKSVGANETTATLTGLEDGKDYPIFVRALNGQTSGPSTSVSVLASPETPAGPTAPTAPTAVDAGAGDLATEAHVTWTAAQGQGTPVTGYTVEAFEAAGTAAVASTDVGSGATSANLGGLEPGGSYEFVVTAKSAVGNTVSERYAYTMPSPELTVPSAPHIVRTQAGNGSVTVEWQAAKAGNTPVTGYTLTATGGTTPITMNAATDATSATLTGLSNGATYTLDLVANSAAGTSPSASYGPSASGTVRPADQLTLEAEYRSGKREWRISGSASITASNTITVTNNAGTRIGTATVAADGSWTLRARNSNVPNDGKAKATSSKGGYTEVTTSAR